MPRERIIIEDDQYGRIDVTREPSPDLVPMRQPANDTAEPEFVGVGPDRGDWEAWRVSSGGCSRNPERTVVVYLPPRPRNA